MKSLQELLHPSWKKYLKSEFSKPYWIQLEENLKTEYGQNIIYPEYKNIFNAFGLTPFDKVKAVILGQDPYHGANQAHGLAFSVQNGVKTPPSLRNIFKELNGDIDFEIPNHGNLSSWAKEGVLLLNTIFTVQEGKPMSHKKLGWQNFSDEIIKTLSREKEGLVFILWGNPSREKKVLIDENKHLILESVHPSPLSASRGYFGSSHFSKTNSYLISKKKAPIKWEL